MTSIYDMEEDNAEDSSSCLVALKFPDDFAEFQARADSGGSTYGVLKRHGFAQQSLRGVVAPSDPELDVVVPQRRANSLVPPAVSSPYTETSAVADQKMIIAVLCDQSPQQQQRRDRYHHHHSHRDLTISDDDDDKDRPQHQRQRSRSLQYLHVVTDKDYYYHHHHHHKTKRHQPSTNQQHLQQPKQPVIKMDTLQVWSLSVWNYKYRFS